MNYDDVRKMIGYIAKDNYKDLVKALVSFENGIDDEKVLDKIFVEFMDCDGVGLLNDDFDHLIKGFNEKTVTLTVAGSGIHNIDEFHENITNVAEAISKFKEISNDPIYGSPKIGIKITDLDNTYVRMDVVTGDLIYLDMLEYAPDIVGNPQAQQMIATLIHDMPEAEIIGEVPKAIQDKIEKMQSKNELNTTNFLDRVKSNSQDNSHDLKKDTEIEI